MKPLNLPRGIRSRYAQDVNRLNIHYLESGHESSDRPCLLLLHGFPELGFSWRKIMVPLAEAGFHVIAPDQRGFGRTTGLATGLDDDFAPFSFMAAAHDAIALVSSLGYQTAFVVGHDSGSPVAARCALLRPDLFRGLVMMSTPFAGTPGLCSPCSGSQAGVNLLRNSPIHRQLAALPRPRKHYIYYFSSREAERDIRNCQQGLHAFLRGYYHHKSADWPGNNTFQLKAWTADELAKLPNYYIMDLDKTMPETVAAEMPSPAEIADCNWLSDEELSVYVSEYERTGFQGGLHWYRCTTDGVNGAELEPLAGRTIDVPSCFISGASDWSNYQMPGELEKMQKIACTRMLGCHFLESTGHWAQQEQPAQVTKRILEFLSQAVTAD